MDEQKTTAPTNTGATSERAFIGAIAAALMTDDRETVLRALDTIAEPDIILTEPATINLFKLYRAARQSGDDVTAFTPVEVSGRRPEVRAMVDECITTFNGVSDGDPNEFIKHFVNEFRTEYQAELYARKADAIRTGDEPRAEQIQKEIDGVTSAPETIENYSNKNLLDYFKERDPATMRRPIKTGFATLDKYTNGGLRDELYVINAGTSAGKTAFVMQIADHIAKTQPVLIFALEMAKTELMARSISRETYEYSKNQTGDGSKYGRSQTEILDFDRFYYNPDEPNRTYSKDETAVIDMAIQNYSKYAPNIYTVETVGQATINDIRRIVTAFNKRFEEYNEQQKQQANPRPIYPVVIIDYLQIMAPSDYHMDERAKTDECVTGLKQISRDLKATIICISAIAKGKYNGEIEIDSGKNSGGIEYTAGTVFGLQYYAQGLSLYGISEKNKSATENKAHADIKTERGREPRYMELTVLKNRSGMVQNENDRIILEYNARYNHFAEVKPELRETVTRTIRNEYAAKFGKTINYDDEKQTKPNKPAKQKTEIQDDYDDYSDLFN